MVSQSRFAIIVAGGSGIRMGTEIPKQFLLINNLPVLMHTINKFNDSNAKIILVLPIQHFDYWNNLCTTYQFTVPHTLVAGGKERYESVNNGLKQITQEGVVAIHDGVRPCVSTELIERCFNEAEQYNNAVAAVKPKDSIRMKQPEGSISVNRDDYYLVQTPQVFQLNLLKNAYDRLSGSHFTDDASVFESAGYQIHLTTGDYKNIKITTPDDLILASAFMNEK
ncbi:MAG: 2-C-methyl-D-erythritol 4-phosphate cytidylyltransferase [Bacteroidia bacterium]|jgi:2-C-methyl-D-erythritol 4-phosphate cytidylyltransferase|nr:2-C-methyl-D-erythritol 4-phosphate cytidylyltransferase [Bacteroidia bacterium]